MHEYLDIAASTGYFDDPRILYDLTPAEIAATIAGKASLEQQRQQLENVRAGTVCATVFNQHRRRKSDKAFSWKDFFPDTRVKPTQSTEDMKRVCREIAVIFGGTVKHA